MSVPALFYGLAVVSFVLCCWASANQKSLREKREGVMVLNLSRGTKRKESASTGEWVWLILSLVFLFAIPFLVAYGVGAE